MRLFYPNYLKTSWSKLLFLIPIFIIIACSLDKKVTGTVDETDTGIVAMLYNPDGTPAIGANVKIFKVADTTKIPISEVISDINGNYSVRGLSKGTYNVYAEKGFLVAFQDSVKVLEDTILIKDDTLETPINLSAIVGLQPNHDPRTVTVQVLGTDIYSNVNGGGYFTLNRMAKGNFTLKLSTTLDNYTTTYKNIILDKNTPDTIPDTLRLIYTGIPVVEGLAATYDTLNGVVTLSWNKTNYRDLQDYFVYRDYHDSLNLSSTPIKFTRDTILQDSIFNRAKSIGKFSFSDTNNYHFKYRVTVRNNSQLEGLSYKYTGIVAASPQKVKTEIEFNLPANQSDTLTINDTVQIGVNLVNMTRNLRSLSFAIARKDSILKTISLDSTKRVASDTLKYAWKSEGNYTVYVINEDISDSKWVDSMKFYVVQDKPVANAGKDTLVLTNTNINLHGSGFDKLGKILKYEWAFGSTDTFYETSTGDTTTKAPSSETDSYKCFLKVTDDDGKTDIDSVEISAKKVFISAPTPNDIVTGVYKVTGVADPTLSEIQVKIASNSWVKATGVTSWSAEIDTRLIYPSTLENLSVKAFEGSEAKFDTTISTKLSNIDPIIGSWSFQIYGGCSGDVNFYSSGLYQSYNCVSGDGSWYREVYLGEPTIKWYDNRRFVVSFDDYNHMRFDDKSSITDFTFSRK